MSRRPPDRHRHGVALLNSHFHEPTDQVSGLDPESNFRIDVRNENPLLPCASITFEVMCDAASEEILAAEMKPDAPLSQSSAAFEEVYRGRLPARMAEAADAAITAILAVTKILDQVEDHAIIDGVDVSQHIVAGPCGRRLALLHLHSATCVQRLEKLAGREWRAPWCGDLLTDPVANCGGDQ